MGVALAGNPRVRSPKNKKYRDFVSIVSFKTKYIAVAVAAAIAVSLAVGSVMVYENRSQHAALLETASADARARVLGELTLRADEVARHISDRVSDAVLRDDLQMLNTEIERFTRDDTMLSVVLRDTKPTVMMPASRAAPAHRCVPMCRPCLASWRRKWSAKPTSKSARAMARRNRSRHERSTSRCGECR
jgi:hypothetical protein